MQLYSVSEFNHFLNYKIEIASRWILFGHEWREIHVLYRAYSEHIAQNWSAKTYAEYKLNGWIKEEGLLEKSWRIKWKREGDVSWRTNDNQIIGAWRKKKTKIRAASWPLEEWSFEWSRIHQRQRDHHAGKRKNNKNNINFEKRYNKLKRFHTNEARWKKK